MMGYIMKDLASKAFKFIAASIGVLVAAYTLGWSGAITLHNLFKTERVEAQAFVVGQIASTEQKLMEIRRADLEGIHGKIDILARQNDTMIKQNTEILKRLPRD